MNKIYAFLIALIAIVCSQFTANAAVTVEMISEELGENIPDPDEDGKEYFNISYEMKVTGAKGHTLRTELYLYNAKGERVTKTNEEPLYNSNSTEIEEDVDTISNWMGFYYNAVLLPPGTHSVTAKLKVYDETSGRYVTPSNVKSHTFQLKSQQAAKGIVIKSIELNHSQYRNGSKGMYLNFQFIANWLKGKNIKIQAQLFKSNGTPIYQNNGKLDIASYDANPAYDITWYTKNQWFFFPYGSIKLPKGRTNCYIQLKFIDKATGKAIPVTGNTKVNFDFTR